MVPFPVNLNMQYTAVWLANGVRRILCVIRWIRLLRKEVQKLVSRNVQRRSISLPDTHTTLITQWRVWCRVQLTDNFNHNWQTCEYILINIYIYSSGLGWRSGEGTAPVGRSRYRSPVVSLGIFFRGIRQFHVPGVDSASKNGGKGGRCVWLTNYHQGPMLLYRFIFFTLYKVQLIWRYYT
jgi:hypothetical protein